MVFLIHRYSGWELMFSSRQELLEYLKSYGFTRRQLYAYAIVEGLGLWEAIASELQPGPQNPASGTPVDLSGQF